jgi:sugar/nucleoside kinase (ribokinase family)
LIVGSMAFDDLELPSGTFRDTVGGSATYAAFAASAFAEARVVAVVGDDFPQDIVTKLTARGVRTEGLERAKGKTFRWVGRYDADLVGRTTLDTQLNVFAGFEPKIPAEFRDTPLVMLGNIHPALQIEVLDRMKSPKLVVADTMNFWIQGEPKALATLLGRVDTLIINDEEARELSGIHNIRKAAADVRKRGPKRVIIKRGEHGALLFDDDGIFAVPGFPLEDVVDPTGAGDSFAGGFIGALATEAHAPALSHAAVRRAMVFGTATASYCVEAVGTARVSTLSAADVEKRVAEIRAIFELPR